ncbi:MAG: RHS repeat-associated core domain-containing protein [Clostridiaceae bacterium]|nr:RHS repeat-associated core domain-containing protein [Clostridiaceae bacterium]MBW4861145.1 RHS repeat-associated core domain-containing protein [Clostridiaceae bacterium]MBW4869889.1 RHS repeat-associated core domain-containing protein [Clostridiaceae bacterium]
MGNRIAKYENGEITRYHYNNLNQLIKEELPEGTKTYQYDKRGNRIKEFKNNELVKTFKFDATDYMTEVWNKTKGTATYTYNGLGNRIGQTLKRQDKPEEKIDYILDLTRPYKNVLERKVNQDTEQYLWDWDLLGTMEEELYLLDELGSPIRSIDKNGETKGIFNYDEFGISNNKNYTFGYTGYEYDDISELNYAQARYYDQHQGRFISRDNIKGSIIYPDSLNDYTYALNQPLDYVDLDGNVPVISDMKDKWKNFKNSKEGIINDEVGYEYENKTKGKNIIIEDNYHMGGDKYIFDKSGKLKVNLKVPVIPVKIKLNKKGISRNFY